MSNILDPDQTRRFVGSDLDPNCLQRLSGEQKNQHCEIVNQENTANETIAKSDTIRKRKNEPHRQNQTQ